MTSHNIPPVALKIDTDGIAELPDDTVVVVAPAGDSRYPSSKHVAYIRNWPIDQVAWRGTDGSYLRDDIMAVFVSEGRVTVLAPATS